MTEFATPEDIRAARPDVPLQTIRRHMRAGGPWFPGARKVGRSWIVPLTEAEAYVERYARYSRTGSDSAPRQSDPDPSPTLAAGEQ